MPLAAGQTLTCYQILGPLGAGGMGEVWRARDTRLEREVAIKVLPEDLADDEERLRRFDREAKTLACLNHPNVAGIYGVDQHEGTTFLALELVPGQDLAARLARGRLPLPEALDVCRQIAEGLEAAHEAGVVHRDLKPANVMVTPEGRVKLLDFGLAKPAGAGFGAGSGAGTDLTAEERRLLGTPGYMAPEQVRGKPADKRVDVWAFGCVLYQCLTGRKAFAGETPGDALLVVLEREPDLSRLPAGTPAYVRRLIARCLDKDPRTRLRDLGEARVALSRGVVHEAAAAPRGGPPAALLVAVAVAAAVGGWLAAGRRAPSPRAAGLHESARIYKLVDWPSTEIDADISPAGDTVVFGSDRDGTMDLWVAQVDAGEPDNLTAGRHSIVIDAIRNVGFDDDGSHAWFLRAEDHRLVATPRSGGAFAPLTEPRMASADWTRDGSRIVYHRAEEGDPIHARGVREPEGAPILPGGPGLHQHFPVWSFDEEWIFLVRGRPLTKDMQLWRVRPDGRQPEQLTFVDEHMMVGFPTPIDEDTVLFVAEDGHGAGPWLWALDLPSRTTHRVAFGTERYTSIAASADGRRLVATVSDPQAALWRVPIQAEKAREPDAGLLPGVPSPRAWAPQFAAGGLFYLSSRGWGDGLWTPREGRAQPVWSGTEEPLIFPPSISPHGDRAAMVHRRGSRAVLSVVSVESGQTLDVLDDSIEVSGSSSWSPEEDAIAIGGTRSDGEQGLFLFPPRGGEPARPLVLGEGANDPVWSPNGDLIVYCGPQDAADLTLRAVRPDGTPVELSSEELLVRMERSTVRFLPDGSGLVFLGQDGAAQDFWLLDLESGQTRRLTELDEDGVIQAFDVTPDGSAIVFDRVHESSDVVLIELGGRAASR